MTDPSTLPLVDPRSFLDSTDYIPALPDDPLSVALCFPSQRGLILELVVEKHISLYSAWLWRAPNGEAFFSKRFSNGKAMAWRVGQSVDRVIEANPSLKKLWLAKHLPAKHQEDEK